ncbi:RHS repeat domain-containing protein [Natroniella sp. ANB-PHB2]|uniref:RHS repeat domain-containing protein n=1 Tax=Natroniella sp. ANB-PHB2 TaxID=3384444 RepID=UPI0038D4A937
MKWEKDYNGNKTEYEYDKLGRLTRKTLADGSYQEHDYKNYQNDGINKKRTIFHGAGSDTSPNQVTEEIYNGLGWLIEEKVKINEEGDYVSKEYDYDGLGQLKWESDFTGKNKTYHEYDSLGRRTRVDHPDGTNVQIDYSYQIIEQNGVDYFTLAKTITNEEGARSRHYLDPDGKALRSIRYQRNEDGEFKAYEVAEFEYDNLGNVTKITSPTDQIFNYKYNERGDILKIEYPDDTREEFTYDNVGNLIEKLGKNGEVVELKHDNLHRLINMEYSTDKDADYLIDTDQDKIIYNYDEDVANGLGNKTSIIDGGDKVEYSYDQFNRVNKISRTLEETGEIWTSKYDYNSQGLLESIVYPSERVVNYDYDLRGLRTGIELEYEGGNKEIASYRYDENGAVEEIIYGNEVIQSEFGYDSRQRLEFIEATNDEELLFSKSYEYDRIGNRSKTVGTFGEETGYLYDDLDRLTEVDYPGNKKSYFEYDPIGNRKELIYRHDTSSENQYHYNYDYNQDNNQLLNYQLSPYSYYEYDYNDNGSVLSKELIRGNEVIEETSYKYDLRNQLREIEISNKLTGASNQVNFAYNNKGWRVMKDTGLEKTYYLYGKGQQVLEERNETGDTQLFIYGNQGRLAVLDEDGELRYVVNDILGSTSVVTDEEGNELVRYKYDPFGNLIRSEGEISDSYRFTGKEFDGTTGLYYYGARFYDPELGRFITEDPAQDGWNWFVYTANNPLKYVDPDGLNYRIRMGESMEQHDIDPSQYGNDINFVALFNGYIDRWQNPRRSTEYLKNEYHTFNPDNQIYSDAFYRSADHTMISSQGGGGMVRTGRYFGDNRRTKADFEVLSASYDIGFDEAGGGVEATVFQLSGAHYLPIPFNEGKNLKLNTDLNFLGVGANLSSGRFGLTLGFGGNISWDIEEEQY